MDEDDGLVSDLTPYEGQRALILPITLDYRGGRSEDIGNRVLYAGIAIFAILLLDIFIGIVSGSFTGAIIAIAIVTYIGFLIIRFPLMHEERYRREMNDRERDDYKIDPASFWGIYKIQGPICYFDNGFIGCFVMLEKGTILEKDEHDKYLHYEALGRAYNEVFRQGVEMTHIDLMDYIGKDIRLLRAEKELITTNNEYIGELVTDMFRYNEDMSEDTVTTYDIYLFRTKLSELELKNAVRNIISQFMQCNYSGTSLLGQEEIRYLASSLFNIGDFSVNMAITKAFESSVDGMVRPIMVADEGGKLTKLNSTIEEEKAEEQRKAAEKDAQAREIARRKAGKTEEAYKGTDLFDEDGGGWGSSDTGLIEAPRRAEETGEEEDWGAPPPVPSSAEDLFRR